MSCSTLNRNIVIDFIYKYAHYQKYAKYLRATLIPFGIMSKDMLTSQLILYVLSDIVIRM